MTASRSCGCPPFVLESKTDYGDGVPIYRHMFDGVAIHTHRTTNTSPAGWVWAVYTLGGPQLAWGYASTRRKALETAAHRVTGRCGYVPRHRGARPAVESPADYVGRRAT